jgi:hypothetical protein
MKRLLIAILSAGVLAACAQVPTSGPIVEVDQPVADVATTSFVRVLARPPQPGMTPTEIVQGFLDAASGFEDGHAVAKEYLTAPAARQWNPQAGVRVYGNDTESLSSPSESTVAMTASQVGLISARDQYLQSPPDSTLSVQFDLVRIGPDWRISRAPQGLLLSRAAVERSYREYETYFVAAPGGILTPDPVLVASSQRDVTADLVESLLAGPSRWLAPAVQTGFPAGTRLLSLRVADGVATVDLSAAVLTADEQARQQLSAQLVWTLRQVAGIVAVEITAEGQPVEVPGAPTPQPRTAWAEYDPDGLSAEATYSFVREGGVLTLDAANAPVPVAGPAGTSPPQVRDPLVSLDETAIAATDEQGRVLTAALEQGSRWRTGPVAGTRGGSWDRTGLLWVATDQGVQVIDVLGARPVTSTLGGITSVQISRDGARAAVLAGGIAYLMRVDRSADPPALVAPRILATGPVRAAAWASATRVALLTVPQGQPPLVSTIDLGLLTVGQLGGPPRARTVTAAPDRPILSGTADGRIWYFNGTTWIPATTGRQPRYPG